MRASTMVAWPPASASSWSLRWCAAPVQSSAATTWRWPSTAPRPPTGGSCSSSTSASPSVSIARRPPGSSWPMSTTISWWPAPCSARLRSPWPRWCWPCSRWSVSRSCIRSSGSPPSCCCPSWGSSTRRTRAGWPARPPRCSRPSPASPTWPTRASTES